MKAPTETEIIYSWDHNARGWKKLIDQEKIESRRLATNDAIVKVLTALPLKNMLDLGCGEGWLVRRMEALGLSCYGVDGSPTMIRLAQMKGEGHYQCLSYSEITEGARLEGSPFDAIVLNFALFDKDSAAPLLVGLQQYLTPRGKLIIQSLHPNAIHAFEPSHWKPNVWEGLPGDFSDTHPWYHRSMADWKVLFSGSGLHISAMHEPEHPRTQQPASVIFVLEWAES